MEMWINLIIAIISGLTAAIPLVVQLVKKSQEAAKSKNWTAVFQIVTRLVKEAEVLYSTGADRKTWVINSIKAMEPTLNYDVDENAIAAMIDSIVDVSKNVNIKK